MKNTESILSDLNKMTPQIPSKTIKGTAYKYAKYIVIISLSIQVLLSLLTLSHRFIFPFSQITIYVIRDFAYPLSLITLILSVIYILYRRFRSFSKEDYKWDNSKKLILHKEKYAKKIDTDYPPNELTYARKLLESQKIRYEKRAQIFGTGVNVSVILGILSIIDKVYGNFSSFIDDFSNSSLTSSLFVYSIAFLLGTSLGTWMLKALTQRLDYKISIIDIALLRKELVI